MRHRVERETLLKLVRKYARDNRVGNSYQFYRQLGSIASLIASLFGFFLNFLFFVVTHMNGYSIQSKGYIAFKADATFVNITL